MQPTNQQQHTLLRIQQQQLLLLHQQQQQQQLLQLQQQQLLQNQNQNQNHGQLLHHRTTLLQPIQRQPPSQTQNQSQTQTQTHSHSQPNGHPSASSSHSPPALNPHFDHNQPPPTRSASTSHPLPPPKSNPNPESESPSPSPSPPSSSSSELQLPTSPSKLTPRDQARLIRCISKDQIHQYASGQGQTQKRTEVFEEAYSQALEDSHLDWLGHVNFNRPPTRFRLQMPIELDAHLAAGKRKHRPRLKFSKQDLKLIANTDEVLVPIRLEIEIDHWKLRDTFTWNLKEPVVTPEQFAIHLCEDLILPIQHFSGPIVSSIKEQLEEYKLHENFQNHLTHPLNAPENVIVQDVKLGVSHTTDTPTTPHDHQRDPWWEGWKQKIISLDELDLSETNDDSSSSNKRIKLEHTPKLRQSSIRPRLIEQDYKPVSLEAATTSSSSTTLEMRDDELRIPIILDVISGNIHLTDRFEWEISEIDNSPELFSEVYANDLGLSGEFKTAIAHSIREQIEIYVKSLALVEHTNGYPVPNDELRYAFLQRVTDPIRVGQVSEFTPFLNLLNAEELDRQEKEHDREARRKRRQTRGRRGITLPDRESQRTVRNIVPIQGLDMVIPYQNENEDLIVPIQPFAQPFAIKESVVDLADPAEYQPKRHIQITKEALVPDSQLGTPSKATGSRASRRLRGATADVAGTPPKSNDLNVGDNNKEDAPTPSNAGTPAVTHPSNNKKSTKADASTNANNTSSSKKSTSGSQPRGQINWEALGLHDTMIDGVWHCSNCGCPAHIAVGRRKGLGGKDTLCGECGKYMHRYKKNRPIMYNTSAEYHISLKLEADKAKQAIADQEVIRKEKNKAENHNLPASLNSKKRKKDVRNSLLPKSEKLRRGENRSVSVASSTKSPESRESSPVVSIRSTTNNGGTEKPHSKKRSRITESSDAPPPTTRAQKSLSKGIVLDSPEVGNSPESNSPNNTRSQSTSGSLPTAKPIRTSSRGSVKTDPNAAKKGPVKSEEDADPEAKSGQTVVLAEPPPPPPAPKTRPGRTKSKNGIKSPTEEITSQQPTESRSGSTSGGPTTTNLGHKESKNEQQPRRSIGNNGRLPAVVSTARRFEPPQWMVTALLNMKNSYASDRVELISRAKKEFPSPGQPPVVVGCDWRLKCLDCPGKLYTVGPGESFTNFDVHLKNRQHRQKVDERLAAAGLLPSVPPHQISPTTSSHTHHQPSGMSSTRSSQQFQQHQLVDGTSSLPPTEAGSHHVSPVDLLSQHQQDQTLTQQSIDDSSHHQGQLSPTTPFVSNNTTHEPELKLSNNLTMNDPSPFSTGLHLPGSTHVEQPTHDPQGSLPPPQQQQQQTRLSPEVSTVRSSQGSSVVLPPPAPNFSEQPPHYSGTNSSSTTIPPLPAAGSGGGSMNEGSMFSDSRITPNLDPSSSSSESHQNNHNYMANNTITHHRHHQNGHHLHHQQHSHPQQLTNSNQSPPNNSLIISNHPIMFNNNNNNNSSSNFMTSSNLPTTTSTTTTMGSTVTQASLLHPPLPNSLVHPLPKKPTFD